MPNKNNPDERSRNLYSQLMRLTAQGNDAALEELLSQAEANNQADENVLRIGLQNAAKKGHAAAARVLLEHGAKTDLTGEKGSPALFWAVSQPQTDGHLKVTELLLRGAYKGCPADTEWKDDVGRTIFMSAAWRGHKNVLKLMLEKGADVNARDQNGRTVLHNLAADSKGRWGDEVIALILEKPIDINARDNRKRTALHWAAATGKVKLVQQLLTRPRLPKPDLSITTSRGKTALHLACDAVPAVPAIVELLLRHGADPASTSDGKWTCLHNTTSIQGSPEVVVLLLKYCPSLLNAETSAGLTALHFAAQAGDQDVVQCLLSYPDIRLNSKDAFYSTPLLRAAQEGHSNVVNQLAPFNNPPTSPYAIDACNGFDATVVDFRPGENHHQNIVQKYTIFETLYGKDKDGDQLVTTQVANIKSKAKGPSKTTAKAGSKPLFRWIHLPANNLAWVEALLSKAFIEGDTQHVDGFRDVERGLSHQHRGPKYHSHFMRPMCQRSARDTQATETLQFHGPIEAALKSASRVNGRNADLASSPERGIARRVRSNQDSEGGSLVREASTTSGSQEMLGEPPSLSPPPHSDRLLNGLKSIKEHSPRPPSRSAEGTSEDASPRETLPGLQNKRQSGRGVRKGRDSRLAAAPGTGIGDAVDPKKFRPLSRRGTAQTDLSGKSAGSNSGKKEKIAQTDSNVVFFMPYLHFETDDRRRRMRQAIKDAQLRRSMKPTRRCPFSQDENLIWGHLESSTGLHLRRTLDQFYLHGIDTEDRDTDQVVGRYCRLKGKEEKIFMVDQLWLWILGPELVITSFPQRWQQPKNDPLNVLDGVIEDINSKTNKSVHSVYDLALLITARCSGAFDRHKPSDEDYQFLDMFESSIGNVTNQETELYKEFYAASRTVHAWLSEHHRKNSNGRNTNSARTRYPAAVDQFLDIGKETELLQEIKDIRDELTMISMVLGHQRTTIPQLRDAICEDLGGLPARDARRKADDQKRMVDMHLNELDRMGRLAAGIEESLLNLLDLKQKQANAFEARFARDQAGGTVRQGQIILVFTMTTIVFLPLSFIASFFAINISEFPRLPNGTQSLQLGFVSKYMFGIGLSISFVLICIAFSIDRLSELARSIQQRLMRRADEKPESLAGMDKLTSASSPPSYRPSRFSQEGGHSAEFVDDDEMVLADAVQPRARPRRSNTSRRMQHSTDIERG